MHRLIAHGFVATLVAVFLLFASGCKTQTSMPSSGMPAPPSSPGSTSSSPSSPSSPSSQSGESGSQSSQSQSSASSSSDSSDQSGDGQQGQEGAADSSAQAGSENDATMGDRELADVGQAVAGAADAVSRAAAAMARAQEKIIAQKEAEGGDAGADETQDEAAGASASNEPNYDPFAEPTAGGGSSDPMAQAAAAVAAAAESVKAAQEALDAESAAASEASAQQKQSRAERRADKEKRKREQRASDDLKSGSERLEDISAELDPSVQPTIDADEEPQNAREALSKAAADLMKARNALITAAVELGYIPEDIGQMNDDSLLVFADMEAMVEFLEMSVEVLASVIEQGGLPDFNTPEYDNAREVLARQSDVQGSPGTPRSSQREVGELEGELDRTLADFDGELSEERRAMRKGDGQVGSGMEDYDVAGETGGAGNTAGSGSVAMGAGDPSNDPGGERAARSVGSEENSNGMLGTGNNAPVDPGDLPDPQGDDVVARQLREAAQAEADPELRARLWEEYRNYRNATGN